MNTFTTRWSTSTRTITVAVTTMAITPMLTHQCPQGRTAIRTGTKRWRTSIRIRRMRTTRTGIRLPQCSNAC